jgi:hypothetical protein
MCLPGQPPRSASGGRGGGGSGERGGRGGDGARRAGVPGVGGYGVAAGRGAGRVPAGVGAGRVAAHRGAGRGVSRVHLLQRLRGRRAGLRTGVLRWQTRITSGAAAGAVGWARRLAAQPDTDADDGFADRWLRLDRTLHGAGRVEGDLTPQCTAALDAVLDAFAKKAGPEDTRTKGQRTHATPAGWESSPVRSRRQGHRRMIHRSMANLLRKLSSGH